MAYIPDNSLLLIHGTADDNVQLLHSMLLTRKIDLLYLMWQSNRASFFGDVVFDSFNKASRDADNILDHMQRYAIIIE